MAEWFQLSITCYLMQPYVDGKVCAGAPTQDPTPVLSCPLGFAQDTQPSSTNSVRQRFTRPALHGSWFTKAWERAFGQACTVMQGCITMCWHPPPPSCSTHYPITPEGSLLPASEPLGVAAGGPLNMTRTRQALFRAPLLSHRQWARARCTLPLITAGYGRS